MRVTAVTSKQSYSGILVPDLDTVKKALYAYSDGVSSASNATRAHQPGITVLGLDMIQPHGNTFVDTLFASIERSLSSERPGFYQKYDYDGVGRFLKTSVNVSKISEGYIVSFNAAYVGNEAEAGIAEHLGAIRALYWSKVSVTLDAAKGEQFVIDLQPIMDALEGSDFAGTTASEVAGLIAAGYKEDWSSLVQRGGIAPLFENDMFEGSIQLEDITVGSYYEQPYVADDSVITGPLHKSWDGEPGFEQPELTIYVAYKQRGDNGILDLTVQNQIIEFTNELSARLSTLVEEVVGADA